MDRRTAASCSAVARLVPGEPPEGLKVVVVVVPLLSCPVARRPGWRVLIPRTSALLRSQRAPRLVGSMSVLVGPPRAYTPVYVDCKEKRGGWVLGICVHEHCKDNKMRVAVIQICLYLDCKQNMRRIGMRHIPLYILTESKNKRRIAVTHIPILGLWHFCFGTS